MVHAQNENVMAAFVAELEKVWGKGNRMVKWSITSHYDEVVMLPSGHLYATEKPKIETHFCFGYDTDYSGHEASDAMEREKTFKKSASAFYTANMEPLNKGIDILEKDGKEYESQCAKLFIAPNYENANIYTVVNIRPNNYYGIMYWQDKTIPPMHEELTEADKAAIINCRNITRDKFKKRLDTYIKKYGTSKLKTWTYWRDE